MVYAIVGQHATDTPHANVSIQANISILANWIMKIFVFVLNLKFDIFCLIFSCFFLFLIIHKTFVIYK